MLTADRVLREMPQSARNPEFAAPAAAGVTLYRGAICAVCQDGTLVPAGTAAPVSPMVAILGIAEHQQINTVGFPGQGAFVGARPVLCRRRPTALPFDAVPSWANVGAPVYAVDDQTVSLTQAGANSTTRLQVGTLAGFDLDGTPYVAL